MAEILGFEEIALTVSLNEYIELAKEYSGDKSYMFINGILTEILERPASDIYVVRAADGVEHMIPAVPAFVLHIDADAGRITVRLIEGM